MLRILVPVIGFFFGFLVSMIALEEVDDFKKYFSLLRKFSLIFLLFLLPYVFFIHKEYYLMLIFLIITSFIVYFDFRKHYVSSWYLHLLLIVPAYFLLRYVEPHIIYFQIFSILLLFYMFSLGFLSHLELFGIGKEVESK